MEDGSDEMEVSLSPSQDEAIENVDENELSILKEAFDDCGFEFVKVAKEYEELKLENATLQREREADKQKFEKEKKRYKDSIDNLNRKMHELQRGQQEKARINKILAEKLTEKEDECKILSSDAADLTPKATSVKQSQMNFEDLKRDYYCLKKKETGSSPDMENELKLTQQERNELLQQNEQLRTKIEELRKKDEISLKIISKHDAEIKKWEMESNNLCDEFKLKDADVIRKGLEIERLKNNLEAQTSEIAKKNGEIEHLSSDLDTQTRCNVQLTRQVNKLTDDFVANSTKSQETFEQKLRLEQNYAELCKEFNKTKSHLGSEMTKSGEISEQKRILQQEFNVKMEYVKALEIQNEDLSKKLEQSRAVYENQKTHMMNQQYEGRYNQAKQEMITKERDYFATVDQLKKEKKECDAKIISIMDNNDRIIRDKERVIVEREIAIKKWRLLWDSKVKDNEMLLARNLQLIKEKEIRDNLILEKESTVQMLNENLKSQSVLYEQLRIENEAQNKRSVTLQTQLIVVRSNRADCVNLLKQRRTELQEMKNFLEEIKQDVRNYKEILTLCLIKYKTDSDRIVENISYGRDDMQKAFSAFSGELFDKVLNAHVELQSINTEKQQLERSLNERNNEIGRLNELINSLQNDKELNLSIIKANNKKIRSCDEHSCYTSNIAELESKIAELKAEIGLLRDENDYFRDQCIDKAVEVDDLITKLSEMDNDRAAMKDEIEEVKEKASQAEQNVNSLNAKLTEVNQQLEKTKITLNKFKTMAMDVD